MKNKILFAMLCIAVLTTGCNGSKKEIETSSQTKDSTSSQTKDSTVKENSLENTKPNTPVKPSPELSDDIYSFKFQYNNTVYSLPAAYSDFVANSWKCEEEYTNAKVKPDLNDISTPLINSNSETRLFAFLSNFGNSVDTIDNCHVSSIIIRSDMFDSSDTIYLPGNIQFNKSTADDIKKAYGTPSSVFEGSRYTKYTYTYDVLSYVDLYIDSTTKTLSEIKIDNPVAPDNIVKKPVSTETPESVSAYTAPKAQSDDFSDYICNYAGDLYQLPAPVSAFIKNGWEIDTTNTDSSDPIECTNSSVNAHDRGWVELKRDNKVIRARVFNSTDNAVTIENSTITMLSSDTSDLDSTIPFTVSKNITLGKSKDELTKALQGLNHEMDDRFCYLYATNGNEYDRYIFILDTETKTIDKIEIDLDEAD
ncbi:hypothetical protein [Anaerosacchariphilus polymeriproducens]|uniref:Lipoprotein n=1 Tax=Anaerosacchariphilus polymeriproducens TaxID=1812858 RepID=A0A371AXP8_9FIRM|nr:hypothetical protein [Anaerosacchariphilus polymeriproducens]RDU24344.1 hypothetical protein DWV06_05050 [Anaerosacchariphilus polymeriproducens]